MKKYKRKQVEIICSSCKKNFMKNQSEVIRNNELSRNNFCSRSCLGLANIKNIPKDKINSDVTRLNSSNRLDEFTGIRAHLTRAKNRHHECNLTLEYLLSVWTLQSGICPYSKVKLVHPLRHCKNNSIFTASLDRIDSSLGYIEGNVQFISMAMNFMKSTMTHNEVLQLLKILTAS
jgi:hypothetical protein